jgi:hypothetical protein
MPEEKIFIIGSIELNNRNSSGYLFSKGVIIEELFSEIGQQLISLADFLLDAFVLINIFFFDSHLIGLLVKFAETFESECKGEDFLEEGSGEFHIVDDLDVFNVELVFLLLGTIVADLLVSIG